MSYSNNVVRKKEPDYQFRSPAAEDGAALNRLVKASPPLDTNSLYCNLLQCSFFSETSIIVEDDYELAGFVTGFVVPKQKDTIFIWQVAVAESARKQGLAMQMLLKLLQQPSCSSVRYLETTITEENNTSKTLFIRLAEKLGVSFIKTKQFSRETHFGGQHDDEILYRLGPINTSLLNITHV
jgi:L-2,4-diaminobutyric acid acetyltransferase